MILVAIAANGVHHVVKEWPDPPSGPGRILNGEKRADLVKLPHQMDMVFRIMLKDSGDDRN